MSSASNHRYFQKVSTLVFLTLVHADQSIKIFPMHIVEAAKEMRSK